MKLTNQAIDNMLSVRVVTGISPLSSNEVHDLVLSLPWDAGIGYDYLHLRKH